MLINSKNSISSLLVAMGFAISLFSHASERELASHKDVVRLTVNKDFNCSKEANINIRAKSAGYFDSGADVIQKLSNVARAILEFECSSIQSLNFTGYTDDQIVFLADAAKDRKWKIWSLPSPLEQLGLYMSQREPSFFYLGTARELLEPYLAIPGIPDSFQATAFRREIERLATVVDGNVGDFADYIQSTDRDFGRYSRLKRHHKAILTAIREVAADQADSYQKTYDKYEPVLREAYWSNKITKLTSNFDLTITQLVEKSVASAKAYGESEYTDYVDSHVAQTIQEEVQSVLNDLPDSTLTELAYSSEFISGFPEPAVASNLPRSAVLLSDLPTQVIAAIQDRLGALEQSAISIIDDAGSAYSDSGAIVETGFALASDFEESGFVDNGASLISYALQRVNTVLDNGFEPFQVEIRSLELDGDIATSLQEQEADFRDLSAQIPGFERYANSIKEKLQSSRDSICSSILRDASVRSKDVQKSVVINNHPYPLPSLACALFENDHRLTGFSPTGDGYLLSVRVSDADESSIKQFKFKAAVKTPGQLIPATAASNSSATENSESAEDLAYLVESPPSGTPDAAGVRECDRLGSDPADPKKLTAGVDLETSNLDSRAMDRLMDSCIAAVENDPSDPRSNYQLGRVLWFEGDEDSARDFIDRAATTEYPAALFLKAEALLARSDAHNDFVDAVNLFKQSGKLGYEPGIAMAKELNPDGAALFKHIKPPTYKDTKAFFNERRCQNMMMMSFCATQNGADLRNCYQVSGTDFECEYDMNVSCSSNAGFFQGMIAQACSNAVEWHFGKFRKTKKQWTFVKNL